MVFEGMRGRAYLLDNSKLWKVDEEQRYGRNKEVAIDNAYINSGVYRKKFNKISMSNELNRLLYTLAKRILKHRAGTMYEDMYWIDLVSKHIIAEEIHSDINGKIIYSPATIKKIKRYDNLITIHSHPSSFPPSLDDLNSNYINKYKYGIVVCHNGTVYLYKSNEKINEKYYKLIIEKYIKIGYDEYEAQIKTWEELQKKFDIIVREVE